MQSLAGRPGRLAGVCGQSTLACAMGTGSDGSPGRRRSAMKVVRSRLNVLMTHHPEAIPAP